MNVTGVVIRTRPENLECVMAAIKALSGCDVHFHDDAGRIIVTVEGESGADDMQRLRQLRNLPNVLDAGVAFTFSDEGMPREMFG
jgi:nitrate reductase NapD